MKSAIYEFENSSSLDGWWQKYWSLVDLVHLPNVVYQNHPDSVQVLTCVKRMKAILEYKKYNGNCT
jgi:hypothetical protein